MEGRVMADVEPDPADAAAWGGTGYSKSKFGDQGRSKSKANPNGADGNAEPDRQRTFTNPRDLQFTPVRPRQWIVDQWLPVGSVTANYGDGAVGKTLLAQQLMTSCATKDVPWCGLEVTQCRSFALFCEDVPNANHDWQLIAPLSAFPNTAWTLLLR
jgi:hypothetical protein